MKIVIASTIVPFIEGGGTFIVDWLALKLKEYGHQVDVVKIPFSSYYKNYLSQAVALRLYHLEEKCDRLICIRMPSYLIKHPNKYLWFIHHYREVYDLWGTKYQPYPNSDEGDALREYIMRADEQAFKEAKRIYTNSKIISKRLWDFNKVKSEVVYPPLLEPKKFHNDEYGDYIYYSSRICTPKRQELAVEAMQYTKTPVKLLLTGKSENAIVKNNILSMVEKNNLEGKVIMEDRWITEEEKIDYFAKSLAALYIPYDEDSYGYPSLEAHQSKKGIITCTDSGGTDELVIDEYNGYMVEPTPQALAKKFDELYLNKSKAKMFGENGYEHLNNLKINWDNVIGRFTE